MGGLVVYLVQMRQRLCLVVLILSLALLARWLSPLACPKPTKGVRPQRIEAAYEQIRRGMTDKELFALMAPYKRFTEHYQWQCWTDGHTAVTVTMWPNGGIGTDEPFQVLDKSMFRVVFNGSQESWVPLSSSRLLILPNKRSKGKTAD